MSNLFFVSDTHFRHHNIIKFESAFRPFQTIEEHDEALIENWNKTVGKNDDVIHVGDVAFGEADNDLEYRIISRLNGKIILIEGNHDSRERKQIYAKYFKDICAYKTYGKDVIISHIPVHTNQLNRWKASIHGHSHSKLVLLPDGSPDARYWNVSVEQINLTPISYEDLKRKHR